MKKILISILVALSIATGFAGNAEAATPKAYFCHELRNGRYVLLHVPVNSAIAKRNTGTAIPVYLDSKDGCRVFVPIVGDPNAKG